MNNDKIFAAAKPGCPAYLRRKIRNPTATKYGSEWHIFCELDYGHKGEHVTAAGKRFSVTGPEAKSPI